MFFSIAVNTKGGKGAFFSGGRSGLFYHGPNTTITYHDGTTESYENVATVANMTGVTDGGSFYEKFCMPIDRRRAVPPATRLEKRDSLVPGYPQPIIGAKDGTVSGYHLTGEGLEDVAVLSILSFQPTSRRNFKLSLAISCANHPKLVDRNLFLTCRITAAVTSLSVMTYSASYSRMSLRTVSPAGEKIMAFWTLQRLFRLLLQYSTHITAMTWT